MKIMIIGSEGMLGHDLVDVLSAEHEISTTTIETLDITDIDKTIKTVKITETYKMRGPIPAPLRSAAITASCAEHGITNCRIAVTIDFSLSVPSNRVVIFAIVIQPNPSNIGITARPFKPI